MHNYPSDITREQFEIIRPDLEAAKRKTRPSDLYDIFCAVLYVLRGVVANAKIFQVGNWFIITSQFGQSLMKTELVCWIKF